MVTTPGFSFEERPKECLPKDFPANIPGSCHFIKGYHHINVPEDAPLDKHIEEGLKDIGIVIDHS